MTEFPIWKVITSLEEVYEVKARHKAIKAYMETHPNAATNLRA